MLSTEQAQYANNLSNKSLTDMNNWVNELIDKSYDFLQGRTAVVTETGTNWAVISTPFIGLFNDTLEVYAKKKTEKFYCQTMALQLRI